MPPRVSSPVSCVSPSLVPLVTLVPLIPLVTLVPLALLALLVSACRADLVLNEVLYDPDGADEGREFVELWNPDSLAVPLDGVLLETSDGARPGAWTVVWRAAPGAVAPPRTAFLVPAGALTAALQNGPDAIRLVRGAAVLDRLGYGELSDGGQYEGAPAADAPSGSSLARVQDGVDSDVNRDDWTVEAEPTPGDANHPDVRLRFGRALPSLAPIVPWPGEPLEIRATVRNSGRLALDGSRWRIVAALGGAAPEEWLAIGSGPGVTIAAGESASVALSVVAPPAGAHRLRLCLEPEGQDGGVPQSVGEPTDGVPPGALADTESVWLRSLAAPVVLSEVAYRNEGAGEWIEIWAREPVADVGALTLADAASSPRPLDRGAVPRPLDAGAYLVVAQDPAAVRSRFGLPDSLVVGVAGGWPSLNDGSSSEATADRVVIASGDGVPADAMAYGAGATVRGGSLERLSADLPSGDPGSWSETVAKEGGTPGRANSVRAPGGAMPRGGALLVAGARVLGPRGSGSAPIVFRATGAARGRRLTVRVSDLLGRVVRTLTDGQRLATEAAFVWDGSDDRGDPAPPGLYVVSAEALPEDGAAPIRSSLSIAIAGGRP